MKIEVSYIPNTTPKVFVNTHYDEDGNRATHQSMLIQQCSMNDLWDSAFPYSKPALKVHLSVLASHGADLIWKTASGFLGVSKDKIEAIAVGGYEFYTVKDI